MIKKCKLFVACLVTVLSVAMTACSSEITEKSEYTEHLYWKDVEATVTDIDYRQWYASGYHYIADVSVLSDEYNLQKTFHLTGSDAKRMDGISKGDTIIVELNSWVIDDTGEVTHRDISSIIK